MSKRIEEVFNDCFERLLLGESLESCLLRYPEYAAELDSMLRTAFDVKRKAFPVQPRPEFKYWARVRMQNIQYYSAPQPQEEKLSVSNLRRNLALSLAALLVLVIASSGTVAASSQAMPDEPLYGVKMAVEQAQLTLTTTDVGKARLYAQLAETRAQEIAVMADKGNTDEVIATTAKLNYQLDQADALLSKYEAALAASGGLASPAPSASTATVPPPRLPATTPVIPTIIVPPPVTNSTATAVSGNTAASTSTTTLTAPTNVENNTVANPASISAPEQPSGGAVAENITAENVTIVSAPVQPPPPIGENMTSENATPAVSPLLPPVTVAAENVTSENVTTAPGPGPRHPTFAHATDNTSAAKRYAAFVQGLKDANTAQTDINASTDKSLSILQNALNTAPESAKSSLNAAIERTRKARERITSLPTAGQNSDNTSAQTSTQTSTPASGQSSTSTSTATGASDNSTQQQGTTGIQQNTTTNQQGTGGHIIYRRGR